MTAPLVLTAQEVEKLIKLLKICKVDALSRGRSLGYYLAPQHALEILTSPRTEALGLSKEEWKNLRPKGINAKGWGAITEIASSLSDKGEA